MRIITVTTTAIVVTSCIAVVALPLMTLAAPVVKPAKGPVALRPIVPVPSIKISRITVIHRGSVALSDAVVLVSLSQKVGGQYDAAAAQQDTKTIESLGLFQGNVTESASPDPSGGVDLTYTVTENPFIKEIRFTANTPDGQPSIPAALLKAKMATKENTVLNAHLLTNDIDALLNHKDGPFWTQGFLVNAGVTRIDPAAGTLTIPLEETHIATIQIQGNSQILTEEIMQQIESKPGDLFNSHSVQADMTRVWHMGKFDTVGPLTETTDEDHQMTVIIPVTEKKSMPQTN